VRLLPGARAGAPSARLRRALPHFAPAAAGGARIRSTFAADPQRRLALVDDLLALASASPVAGEAADPGLEALLRSERRRLEAAAVGASVPPGALRGLRRKLYPYQREAVARFLARGRLLLADDMGLGKTVQAIAACHALYRAKRIERGLLIVPATLKVQWQREWEATSDVPVALVEGSPPQRAHAYRACARGFLVANYEQVLRDLASILEWEPALVVLDEAQRIKNWATKTAGFVKRLEPPWRLVLTGTPMENRLEELASIMDWVDDQALEPKWRLAPWHSVTADGSREVVGARHLETLRTRLAPSMVRRVRREVLDQLPPRTDTLVPVEISDAQREEHDALNMPIASLLRRARQRPLTQAEFLRLMNLLATQRIIANGLAQHRFLEVWPGLEKARPSEGMLASLASPKLGELRALVTGLALDQGRKVVVFSQWRRMLRLAAWAVGDLLEAAGVRAAFFTGQEGPRQRTRNLLDFHDDPATRVLFATDAGGVGLNLQRAASACINCDLPWNPAVLEQRIGRIYRIGQTEPIHVYNLMSEESIEARIARLVADKRALFTGLFDGESDAVSFDRSGSFLAGLERLFEEVAAPERDGEDAEAEVAEEAAIDALLEGADDAAAAEPPARSELPPAPPRGESVTAARSSAGELARLLASLEIQKTAEGAVRIEAPPEAAAALSALFVGLARMLQDASREERT
jgi:SNF2 family DNA or RNA helicase